MKFFTLIVLVSSLSALAFGDTLKLRNGMEFTGHYIGGTNTEIWFQRDGMVPTTEVIPTSLVEALKFEPAAAGPAAAQVSPTKTWLGYFKTVLATAWFANSSSTRTATVISPGGRAASVMR
jgi:hypothetical protein